MRWLVGLAFLSATGVGIAAAQTESAEPSVTVDLTAIPAKEKPRVYTGERVVFPLIYPDGSMAAAPPRPASTAPAQPVTLTPPGSVAPGPTEPDAQAVPAETDQAALATPPAASASSQLRPRIPVPLQKPSSLKQAGAEDELLRDAREIPGATARVNLFSEPPQTSAHPETRESKPDQQLAAISPEFATAPVAAGDGPPQVLFLKGGTELDGAGMAVLDALALQLSKGKERIELQAFASTSHHLADSAKKLSLRRALAVRTYLIGKGIDGNRIIIKAKGDATEGAPERVDILRTAG